MVAGPAGAFICRNCVGAAADIVCVPSVRTVDGAEVHPAVPAPELLEPPRPVVLPPEEGELEESPAPPSKPSFIEAAVVLSKELGWSLADIRSLSPDEVEQALQKLDAIKR
jgi:hypothetical protein